MARNTVNTKDNKSTKNPILLDDATKSSEISSKNIKTKNKIEKVSLLNNNTTTKHHDKISKNVKKIDYTMYNKGHRERVREKFLKTADLSSFKTYELIEILLFYCNKRSDVKPLAKDIDSYFESSIHKILNSDIKVFNTKFKGIGSGFLTLLKLIKELESRNIYETIKPQIEIANLTELIKYLRVFYNQQKKEIFKALFLDAKSKIIAEKIMSEGTINQAIVYPREIVKECLEINAAYVIISHNHPSGDPTPSKEDLLVTLEIQKSLSTIDIVLFDSLIITKESYYSFKENGYL